MEGGNQTDVDGNEWVQVVVIRNLSHIYECDRMIEKMISFDF